MMYADGGIVKEEEAMPIMGGMDTERTEKMVIIIV